jgi:hypothetical protein
MSNNRFSDELLYILAIAIKNSLIRGDNHNSHSKIQNPVDNRRDYFSCPLKL